MFKNSLADVFPFVHRFYDLSELILVGSDIVSWLDILQKSDVEKVHYINQSSLDYRFDSLPKNWEVSSTILAEEDGETTFYEPTNSMLNGTVGSEVLAKLWKNLETINTTKREALTLKSFIENECIPNSSKMLVIDSFDGLSILGDLDSLEVDIVAVRVVADDDEEFVLVSQGQVEQKLTEWGYKNIATYEDNHPKIKNTVYIKDTKQQIKELNEVKTELQNITKELVIVTQTKEQGLSKLKIELENKTKELQENINNEHIAEESLQKKLKEIKTQQENKIIKLTTEQELKNQEFVKLKTELERKTKELDESLTQQDIKVNTLKNELQEKNSIIESLIVSKDTVIKTEYLNTLTMQKKVQTIVSHSMHQENVLQSIDFYILGNELNEEEKFEVCCEFAQQIAKAGDKMQGVGFITNAKLFMSNEEKLQIEQYKKLINIANILHLTLAVDLEMEYNGKYGIFTEHVNKRLFSEYKKIRSASNKQQQHGQDLLIDYINEKVKDGEGKGKILVEIGTTRENIPGQGSTLQLANLCKRKGIKFITVDMDAHNTRWANFISKKYDLNIEAITRKGEDYLKHDIDSFDFVFLDAYDFEHGKHSELRQSRYKMFLEGEINEKKSHKMHLKCAKSVLKKLQPSGVICIDDTWRDDNKKWAAKGALAVPHLLRKGFIIIQERNNAVIMERSK